MLCFYIGGGLFGGAGGGGQSVPSYAAFEGNSHFGGVSDLSMPLDPNQRNYMKRYNHAYWKNNTLFIAIADLFILFYSFQILQHWEWNEQSK